MPLSNPASSSVFVAKSAAAINTPADTTEDLLVSIPLLAQGVNAQLVLTVYWTMTPNANAKNLRTRLGGLAGTLLTNINLVNAPLFRNVITLFNRGAANSQFFTSSGGLSGGDAGTLFGTLAFDLSIASTLCITAQKGAAGDQITLEAYELLGY